MNKKRIDMGNLLDDVKVKTGHKLYSDGRVTTRQNPIQVTHRLPSEQVNWLKKNVDGNLNYAVSQIIMFGIKTLKEHLVETDYDVADLNK